MAAPERMSSTKRVAILQGLHDLPSLSDVVTKTLEATDRDTTTAAEIERLVSTDAALSAKILRVVNSAYYGLSGQVSSLSQAVVILGMQQIRNLVLSISALSLLKGRTPEQRALQQCFWMHSFATAACAQGIARRKRFGVRESELVFTAGLLHDIGKLFLFCNHSEAYLQVVDYARKHGCSLEQAELALLGVRHQEVGFELANTWHFPEPLTLLIGRHEGPFDGEPLPMLYAVHAADRLTEDLYYAHGESLAQGLDPLVSEWLELDEPELEILRAETDVRVKESAALYGLAVEQ